MASTNKITDELRKKNPNADLFTEPVKERTAEQEGLQDDLRKTVMEHYPELGIHELDKILAGNSKPSYALNPPGQDLVRVMKATAKVGVRAWYDTPQFLADAKYQTMLALAKGANKLVGKPWTDEDEEMVRKEFELEGILPSAGIVPKALDPTANLKRETIAKSKGVSFYLDMPDEKRYPKWMLANAADEQVYMDWATAPITDADSLAAGVKGAFKRATTMIGMVGAGSVPYAGLAVWGAKLSRDYQKRTYEDFKNRGLDPEGFGDEIMQSSLARGTLGAAIFHFGHKLFTLGGAFGKQSLSKLIPTSKIAEPTISRVARLTIADTAGNMAGLGSMMYADSYLDQTMQKDILRKYGDAFGLRIVDNDLEKQLLRSEVDAGRMSKEEYDKIIFLPSNDEIHRKALHAAAEGALIGMAFQVPGTFSRFKTIKEVETKRTELRKRGVQVDTRTLTPTDVSVLHTLTEGETVFAKNHISMLEASGKRAVELARKKLLEMDESRLDKMLTENGLAVEGNKFTKAEALMRAGGDIPEIRELHKLELRKEMDMRADMSLVQKHAHDWAAEGSLRIDDVENIVRLFESIAIDSKYSSFENMLATMLDAGVGEDGYISLDYILGFKKADPQNGTKFTVYEDGVEEPVVYTTRSDIQPLKFDDELSSEMLTKVSNEEYKTVGDIVDATELNVKEKRTILGDNFIIREQTADGTRTPEIFTYEPDVLTTTKAIPESEVLTEQYRSEVAVTKNGFAIRLFQNGDVTVLGHEVFRGVNQTYTEKLWGHYGERAAKKMTSKERVVATDDIELAIGKFTRRETLTKADKEIITHIMEAAADDFVRYITTDVAPIASLEPRFRRVRNKYKETYKLLRKERDMHKPSAYVDDNVAKMFDRYLAREEALPRPRRKKITFTDADGVVHTLDLYKTRPKDPIIKAFIKHMRRYEADISGLQERVKEIMKAGAANSGVERIYIPLAEADNITYLTDAIKLLGRFTKKLQAQVNKELKRVHGEIRKTYRELTSPNIHKDIRKLVETIMKGINENATSDAKIRELVELRQEVEQAWKDSEVPNELRGVSVKDMKRLEKLSEVPIKNLSLEDSRLIRDALADLQRYEAKTSENFVKKRLSKLEADAEAVATGLDTSHLARGKKADKRLNKKTPRFRSIEAIKRFNREKMHPLHLLEYLANSTRFGDGIQRQAGNLRNAAILELEMYNKFKDDTEALARGLDVHKISNRRGKVAKKDMITVSAKYIELGEKVDSELSLTPAEAMLIYGYTFDETALTHVRGGLVDDKRPDRRYILTDDEIQTLVSQLTPEQKAFVRYLMAYFKEEVAPHINKISMSIFGREIATVEAYLPLFIEYFAKQNLEGLNMSRLTGAVKDFHKQMLVSLNFTNTRVGGTDPVHIRDIFDGTSYTLTQVARFVALTEPIQEFKYVFFGDRGSGKDSNWTRLGKVIGLEKRDMLWDFISNIESPKLPQSKGEKAITSLLHLGQSSAIRNISTGGLQATSYILGAGVMGAKPYEVATPILRGLIDPDSPFITCKYSREEMSKLSPLVEYRYKFGFISGIHDDSNSRIAGSFFRKDPTVHGELMKIRNLADLIKFSHVVDAKVSILSFMDGVALSKLLEQAEIQGKKKGWDRKQVLDEWEKQIINTQPTNIRMFQSIFMATGGPIKRGLFGMFKSQIDAMVGSAEKAWYDISNARNSDKYQTGGKMNAKGKALLKKSLQTLAYVYLIYPLIVAMYKDESSEVLNNKEHKDGYFTRIMIATITQNLATHNYITGDALNTILNAYTSVAGFTKDGRYRGSAVATPTEDFYVQGVNNLASALKYQERGQDDKAAEYFQKAFMNFSQMAGYGSLKTGTQVKNAIEHFNK